MSKAFTREDDAEPPERPGRVRPPSGLPPGAVNYMTARGAETLRWELDRLMAGGGPHRRVEAVGVGDPNEEGSAERIADLRRRLESATVVPVPEPPPGTVLFGATVTLLDPHGVRTEHRIVGADETDLGPGWISWVSPLARALIGARVGQRVQIDPGGLDSVVEIVAIGFLRD